MCLPIPFRAFPLHCPNLAPRPLPPTKLPHLKLLTINTSELCSQVRIPKGLHARKTSANPFTINTYAPPSVSVENKRLITPLAATLTRLASANPLAATLTKYRGVGGILQASIPIISASLRRSTLGCPHLSASRGKSSLVNHFLQASSLDSTTTNSSNVLVQAYLPELNRFCTRSPIVTGTAPGYTLSSIRRYALTGSERRTTQR